MGKELKDNIKDEKRFAKCGDYVEASHISSVNVCLEYCIDRLKYILENESKTNN